VSGPKSAALRAVIFDMDGLLIDSEVIYRMAWLRAIGEFQREMPEEIFRRFLGRNNQDSRAMLAEIYGVDFDVSGFLDACGAIAGAHIDTHGIPHKPGLAELLAQLDERQLAAGVATSTRREWAMRSLGSLAARFKVLTTGDEVTRGKPAPDIFLLCAERLQAAPHECLVLEDSEAGIRAAHAAGMAAIMIPDLVEPSEEVRALAWRVCRSLEEVVPLL
jgi:HAD superfamily hydrolase (TIGR01509 family)